MRFLYEEEEAVQRYPSILTDFCRFCTDLGLTIGGTPCQLCQSHDVDCVWTKTIRKRGPLSMRFHHANYSWQQKEEER